MNFQNTFAQTCIALTLTCTAAFAQDTVEMTDTNANFTMQLGGNIAWNVDSELAGKQSTVIAATPDDHDPFTMVSATTYLKVNPLAMMGASIAQKTVEGFLEGACENFKCVDISSRTYEDFDGQKAWIVTTMLDLPAYADLGIPEAVIIATASPEGYMQMFSLHAPQGKTDPLRPVLIDAFKTISPLKQ